MFPCVEGIWLDFLLMEDRNEEAAIWALEWGKSGKTITVGIRSLIAAYAGLE
jgi:hypothetical protein